MPQPRILSGPEAIAEGVRALAAGALCAFPTETVYGLGADARSADAVARVFALKGRPSNNPLIVHVSGPEMARRVVANWTDDADRLAGAFWPGPLTLVLPRAPGVPDAVTASGPSVAVRCPDHPIVLALIEAFGAPVVGPSANPSGRISPTTADHVAAGFAGVDLLVIDGGPCRAGIESTVLDLTADTPRVLRPGVIGADAIARVLARPVLAATPDDAPSHGLPHHRPHDPHAAPIASPGLLGPHYQPRTPVALTTRPADAARADALIAWSVSAHPCGGQLLPIPREPGPYAAAIYARLHEADRLNAARILVETPPGPGDPGDEPVRQAVLERLRRAAGGDPAPTVQ